LLEQWKQPTNPTINDIVTKLKTLKSHDEFHGIKALKEIESSFRKNLLEKPNQTYNVKHTAENLVTYLNCIINKQWEYNKLTGKGKFMMCTIPKCADELIHSSELFTDISNGNIFIQFKNYLDKYWDEILSLKNHERDKLKSLLPKVHIHIHKFNYMEYKPRELLAKLN
jgi:hypothetical protein